MLSGMLLLEVRFNDIITQNIYDMNDNTDRTLKYINPLNNVNNSSIEEELLESDENITRSKLIENKYYTVEKIEIKDTFITSSSKDSFDVLVVLDGHSILFHRMGEISLYKGDTLLIPSACGEYTIEGHSLIMDIHA
jgi:mannose-6-phosphate isomerase